MSTSVPQHAVHLLDDPLRADFVARHTSAADETSAPGSGQGSVRRSTLPWLWERVDDGEERDPAVRRMSASAQWVADVLEGGTATSRRT